MRRVGTSWRFSLRAPCSRSAWASFQRMHSHSRHSPSARCPSTAIDRMAPLVRREGTVNAIRKQSFKCTKHAVPPWRLCAHVPSASAHMRAHAHRLQMAANVDVETARAKAKKELLASCEEFRAAQVLRLSSTSLGL